MYDREETCQDYHCIDLYSNRDWWRGREREKEKEGIDKRIESCSMYILHNLYVPLLVFIILPSIHFM